MKVVLDLDKLRAEGKITTAEYDKLSSYAKADTGSLAFNLLIGFGVVAVTCSVIALVPTPLTAILLGFFISMLGFGLSKSAEKWALLASICSILGVLVLSGGILWLLNGEFSAWLLVTALLGLAGVLCDSGLLVVLSVFSLSATVGASTLYRHAMYGIMVDQPTVTILLFTLLGIITFLISKHVSLRLQRLAILASRTAMFLVNMAFWVGSLFGDKLSHDYLIPDTLFAVIWALLLVSVSIWAAIANKRWVLNTCAIFGAIHFYTQWFERLGATPTTVLFAGLLALCFAVVIRKINTQLFPT
jgi:hypothetical protein